MTTPVLQILNMPNWKSKVLRAVAWILGYRGEYVYCITMNYDLNDYKDAQAVRKILKDGQ